MGDLIFIYNTTPIIIQIIIMDLKMPINGVEATKIIRKELS
jgi:CheY-like chemotaxis protein